MGKIAKGRLSDHLSYKKDIPSASSKKKGKNGTRGTGRKRDFTRSSPLQRKNKQLRSLSWTARGITRKRPIQTAHHEGKGSATSRAGETEGKEGTI